MVGISVLLFLINGTQVNSESERVEISRVSISMDTVQTADGGRSCEKPLAINKHHDGCTAPARDDSRFREWCSAILTEKHDLFER